MEIPVTHLSYSSVSLYLSCPRAWRYRYVDKIPTPPNENLLFGTAFHKTVEGYIQMGRFVSDRKDRPTLEYLWDKEWEHTFKAFGQPLFSEELRRTGAKMLAHRQTVAAVDAIEPVDVERKITLNVPGVLVPIIGYIDVVLVDGRLGDFKTSKGLWQQEWAERETQPAFYLAATGGHGFRHYVFPKAEPYGVQVIDTEWPDPQGIAFPMVQEAWAGIEAGRFECRPERCSWCDYQDVCDGGVEVY